MAAITAQRLTRGLATPTADTGDDCKARAKLSEAALRELTVEIADELEVQADPKWMDQATYEAIPETMLLRELRFHVSQPGRRTTEIITIATTLTDAEVYTKEDIAELYGFRWNAELDIRSI